MWGTYIEEVLTTNDWNATNGNIIRVLIKTIILLVNMFNLPGKKVEKKIIVIYLSVKCWYLLNFVFIYLLGTFFAVISKFNFHTLSLLTHGCCGWHLVSKISSINIGFKRLQKYYSFNRKSTLCPPIIQQITNSLHYNLFIQ